MPHIDVLVNTLPEGQPTRLESGDFGVVVIRTNNGVFAYEDVCPHAKYRLSAGEVIGDHLECPGHGWEFQVSTGRCVTVPAYCLRTVRVEALDSDVVRLEWDQPPAAVVASKGLCGAD